jgi:hypothetical protein
VIPLRDENPTEIVPFLNYLFIAVNVLLVAIWAVSGAGYFWPAWVMVWWAFALVLKSGPRLIRTR